ncbi:M48 family metallopeptidase [Oceanicoccus sagamiensis]|uniref:Peptidase M48 domain-containing protein n=1 Tax=Oceanicoccus sagamiensis TaxID=716816 RepID=A0A1X9NDQ0_9GAMM|nr:M48 family metallopeptidase [Oceanicoccus sagamiensis]ARN74015.1 hypothetical protein BST96_07710 [Oceanicoccus sagamiensis]
MNYQNPKIPEGINISDEHPLKDFAAMLIGVGVFIVAAFVIIFALAEWLVRFVPFEVETRLAESTVVGTLVPAVTTASKTQKYLTALTADLVQQQQLPEDISVTVHYIEGDTVNAYATLGGHIIIYQGLLEKLPNENALAMVLAHEIAHIKHRDPIIAMGRGVTIALAMASLSGVGENAVAETLINQINFLTAMAFSRDQEKDADDEALKTLLAYYGHIKGAEDLFALFQHHQSFEPPEFLSSHPVNQERIDNIRLFQQANNYTGATRPLPPL